MDKLNCPLEEDWDVFLLTAELSRRPDLIRHLADSQMCQVTVRRREEVLEMLRVATEGAADQALVIRHFSPMQGTLHNGLRIAAAQGETTAVSKSLSMVSTDESVLVKVVEDEHTRESWLYVIADSSGLYRNVLVRPFGDAREFLTDENGRVNLGAVAVSSIDPGKAEIVLPTAVFKLVPFANDMSTVGRTTLRSEFGDEIKVSLSDTGTARGIKVEIVKLARRAADRPIRIAVRDLQTGRSRMLSPSELLSDIPAGPISLEFFIFQ